MSLSDKMIFMKSADGELIQCIYYAHIKKFIKKTIEEDLEMCKVCGGSHGKWLDKEDFVRKFKKRVGAKLLEDRG